MEPREDSNWRPGPEVERAHHFDAAFCDRLGCGLHIIPFRKDGTPICEVVMSATQTLTVIQICQGFLYDKATRQDDSNGA